jgi:hypothetical protein
MCVVCGATDHLEFHEAFGEDHGCSGKMQQRILLCPTCHADHHPYNYNVASNPNKSMLMPDVNAEVIRCGGYSAWIAMYMLDDDRWGISIGAKGEIVG